MIPSLGYKLLETSSSQQLWLASLASATALTVGQIQAIIEDRLPITPQIAKLLERALHVPASSWLQWQHDYQQAVVNGDPVQQAGEIPEWMFQSKLTEGCHVPSLDSLKCMTAGTINRALDWWLPNNQVLTMGALFQALEMLIARINDKSTIMEMSEKDVQKSGDKKLAQYLRRRGYHPRQERLGCRVLRVWRYNPCRLGDQPSMTRKKSMATTFDDITDNDIKKYDKFSGRWELKLIHFLDDHPRFTIYAVARALGVGVPSELPALRKQLKARGFSQKNNIWSAGGVFRPERFEVTITGYVPVLATDPTKVLCQNGSLQSLDVAISGHCQPMMYRTESRLLASRAPKYKALAWPPPVAPEQRPEEKTVAPDSQEEEETELKP